MRRVVALIVLVAFVINCGISIQRKTPETAIQQQQEYPARTEEYAGTVIVVDAEKREELDLFPGVEGFKEAQFIGTRGGGYDVEIFTDTGKLISVNEDSYGMAILHDYLNNYEEIRRYNTTFEAKWGILDYDALGAPITQSEVNRYIDPGKAFTGGCAAGCAAAGVAGLVIGALAVAATQNAGASGADMGVGIGIMVAGALATALVAVTAGALTGCLTGRGVSEHNKRKAIEKIKEQRKPRVVEYNGEE